MLPPDWFLRILTAVHIAVYRLTGGALGGRLGRAPVLLLTTKGRKTGKRRTTPLLYVEDGDSLVVVASKGGAPKDPAWWRNLVANPVGLVEVGRRKMLIRAERAGAADLDRLWPRLVAIYPSYETYRTHTTREFPVVFLRPLEGAPRRAT